MKRALCRAVWVIICSLTFVGLQQPVHASVFPLQDETTIAIVNDLAELAAEHDICIGWQAAGGDIGSFGSHNGISTLPSTDCKAWGLVSVRVTYGDESDSADVQLEGTLANLITGPDLLDLAGISESSLYGDNDDDALERLVRTAGFVLRSNAAIVPLAGPGAPGSLGTPVASTEPAAPVGATAEPGEPVAPEVDSVTAVGTNDWARRHNTALLFTALSGLIGGGVIGLFVAYSQPVQLRNKNPRPATRKRN